MPGNPPLPPTKQNTRVNSETPTQCCCPLGTPRTTSRLMPPQKPLPLEAVLAKAVSRAARLSGAGPWTRNTALGAGLAGARGVDHASQPPPPQRRTWDLPPSQVRTTAPGGLEQGARRGMAARTPLPVAAGRRTAAGAGSPAGAAWGACAGRERRGLPQAARVPEAAGRAGTGRSVPLSPALTSSPLSLSRRPRLCRHRLRPFRPPLAGLSDRPPPPWFCRGCPRSCDGLPARCGQPCPTPRSAWPS